VPPQQPKQQSAQQQQQVRSPQLLLGALHWQPPSWKGAAAAVSGPSHVDAAPTTTKGTAGGTGLAAGSGLLAATSRTPGQEVSGAGLGRRAGGARQHAAAVDLTADSSDSE
jgi:hypothetical protein